MAVKVYVRTSPHVAHREQMAYEHLSNVRSSHSGRSHIRQLLDYFYVQKHKEYEHLCFVYKPLQTTMLDLQRFGGKARQFPEDLVQEAVRIC